MAPTDAPGEQSEPRDATRLASGVDARREPGEEAAAAHLGLLTHGCYQLVRRVQRQGASGCVHEDCRRRHRKPAVHRRRPPQLGNCRRQGAQQEGANVGIEKRRPQLHVRSALRLQGAIPLDHSKGPGSELLAPGGHITQVHTAPLTSGCGARTLKCKANVELTGVWPARMYD